MNPVCTKCGVRMHCIKNESYFISHTFDEIGDRGPYQVYMCDLFTCGNCKSTILTGFGKPAKTHPTRKYMDELKKEVGGSFIFHEKKHEQTDTSLLNKCPDCGSDLKSYHSPGITRKVCINKCNGYKVIFEITH